MSVLNLIPAAVRSGAIALLLVVVAGAAASVAWTVQDWRYGNALAKQEAAAADVARGKANAAAAILSRETAQRFALEGRLSTNDETHHKELSDAKKAQKRLSDRLATADVRLSVLLSAVPNPTGVGLPAATAAGSVVYGATRARLDPAHAQRIIGITGDGDQGLIALAACQAYAKEVSTAK